MSGAQGAQNDVRSDAQVQLPEQVQVQLPAQLSNSTGPAKSLIEPVAQLPLIETANVAARPFAMLPNFLASAILQMRRGRLPVSDSHSMTFAPYARRHGVSHRRRRGGRRL